MALISNQSVFIDVKQLLPLSYELNSYLDTKDLIMLGNDLVKLNMDICTSFCLAYRQADERGLVTYFDKQYEFLMNGAKLDKVDACLGYIESYKTLFEFIWEHIELRKVDNHRKTTLHGMMFSLLGKIDDGMRKWRNSIPKKYSVLVKDKE